MREKQQSSSTPNTRRSQEKKENWYTLGTPSPLKYIYIITGTSDRVALHPTTTQATSHSKQKKERIHLVTTTTSAVQVGNNWMWRTHTIRSVLWLFLLRCVHLPRSFWWIMRAVCCWCLWATKEIKKAAAAAAAALTFPALSEILKHAMHITWSIIYFTLTGKGGKWTKKKTEEKKRTAAWPHGRKLLGIAHS